MLDVMREKSRSWFIKVIFTIIILSFIFFFGYSSLQKNAGRGGNNTVAKVNGHVISAGRYRLAFENVHEFYKKMFKGEIPDNMQEKIKETALYQVIDQELFVQLAKTLGISVSDPELYDAIANDPTFQKDGVFDPIAYRKYMLPYFEQKFGLNYELFLRDALLEAKVKSFLASQVSTTDAEAKNKYEQTRTLWSYERVSIPESPAEGVTYDKSAEEIARDIQSYFTKGQTAELNKALAKYKLKSEPLKDVSVDKSGMLIPNSNDLETASALFSLTPLNPTPAEPVKAAGYLYAIKLTSLSRPTDKDWEKDKTTFISTLNSQKKQDYLKEWEAYIRDKASIDEYVLNSGK